MRFNRTVCKNTTWCGITAKVLMKLKVNPSENNHNNKITKIFQSMEYLYF